MSHATTADRRSSHIRELFADSWRDGNPVFRCCRQIGELVADSDDAPNAASPPQERVQALRAIVESARPGHLDAHRCCAMHLADLGLDWPELGANDD